MHPPEIGLHLFAVEHGLRAGFLFLFVNRDVVPNLFGINPIFGFVDLPRDFRFRDPRLEFRDLPTQLQVASKIIPFPRILLMIVKFLATIAVANIAIPFGADCVVASTHGHESRSVPFRVRVFQQWHEADSIELWFFREAAQFDQGGIEIEKAYWPFANQSRSGYTWSHNDQRNVIGLLPEGEFHAALLVAQVVAMIGPKDNDGVIGLPRSFELV